MGEADGRDRVGQLAGSRSNLHYIPVWWENLWRVSTVFKVIPLAAEENIVQRPMGGQVSGLDTSRVRGGGTMDWSATWGHTLLGSRKRTDCPVPISQMKEL